MIVKMDLFKLTSQNTCWHERAEALVLAETPEQANTCMVSGSDSPWISVDTCSKIGTLDFDRALPNWYQNAGAYLLRV